VYLALLGYYRLLLECYDSIELPFGFTALAPDELFVWIRLLQTSNTDCFTYDFIEKAISRIAAEPLYKGSWRYSIYLGGSTRWIVGSRHSFLSVLQY
jgi:hypothetical protein